MAKQERYLVGGATKQRVDALLSEFNSPGAGGGADVPTRLQHMQRRGKGSKYFRITEALTPCFSAPGDEVRIINLDCLEFEPVEDGLTGQEVFDCSNAVRVFNLVSQEPINQQAPVGTVVEAVQDTKYGASDEADPFWRILQVLSCDCGSQSSGSSDSSSPPSDSSGSPPSYSSTSSSYSSSSSYSTSPPSYSSSSSSYSTSPPSYSSSSSSYSTSPPSYSSSSSSYPSGSSNPSGSSGSPPSGSSGSSDPPPSGSSGSSDPPPPPPPFTCQEITVVTGVSCENGSLSVTTETITVAVCT
jgi:hypothetical protein